MTKLSDFDLDLAVGQEGEALVEQLLTGGTTVEVKTDLKWKDTGNLYIETVCWSHNNERPPALVEIPVLGVSCVYGASTPLKWLL